MLYIGAPINISDLRYGIGGMLYDIGPGAPIYLLYQTSDMIC